MNIGSRLAKVLETAPLSNATRHQTSESSFGSRRIADLGARWKNIKVKFTAKFISFKIQFQRAFALMPSGSRGQSLPSGSTYR